MVWLSYQLKNRRARSGRITNRVKQAQYVATQKHIFSFRVIISVKVSTSAVGMFGYIDVINIRNVLPK